MSKKEAINQGCMSLEYGRHLEQLRHRRHRRHRRAYTPTSNSLAMITMHEKNQLMGFLFFFPWRYGPPELHYNRV